MELADTKSEHMKLVVQALADIDAGDVIDHQVVQEWSNSLDTDHPLAAPGVGR